MVRKTAAHGAVRMQDVALRAKVSQMTVSRALRNPQLVSAETRRAIETAIRETGYVPNGVASSLASRRTNIVAAVIPSIAHSSLEGVIEGMMDEVRRRGYHLLLGTSGESIQDEAAMIEALLTQRPRGLLLHNTVHAPAIRTALVNAGIPVVETGDLSRDPLHLCVSYSNFDAAKAMTEHLLERGYRRIAFVSLPARHNERTKARRAGYKAALRDFGLPVAPEQVIETGLGFAGGVAAMRRIIEAKHDFDAVFFGTAILALGGLHACREQGWEVPARVAIAGFEDGDFAATARPALTTVRVPRYEIGSLAATLLCDSLDGKRVEQRAVRLDFEIVQRESA